MTSRSLAVMLGAVVLGGCQLVPPQGDELNVLLDEWFDFAKSEDPLFATRVADHQFNDLLPSVTEEDRARRVEHSRRLLERLDAIDPRHLSLEDRITYGVFRQDLASDVEAGDFDAHLIPFTSDSGFHLALARLARNVPLGTVDDYRNYLSRLHMIPAYMDQHIALLRLGLERGFTMPRVVMEGFDQPIRSHTDASNRSTSRVRP